MTGTPSASGHVVEIEDKGTGMSDDELMRANDLLADPPAVDSALSQRLGLHVVARLAQRHGIRVQLRHSWYNGVTALVLLPDRLLVYPAAETGTVGWRGGQPTHHAWSAVPRGSAVAVMPPPPARTSQPADQPHAPLRRHARQPVPDEPQSPAYQPRTPDQQRSWLFEPPPDDEQPPQGPTVPEP